MDPDDFMRQKGLQAFQKLLEKASDFLDRKMEIISQRLDFEIVSEREKGAEKLLESVARCRNELVKNLYLKKSAEFIGVPETVMAERLNRISSRFVARAGKQPSPEKLAAGGSLRKIEYYLLALCFHHPDYIEKTIENLGDKPFRDKKIAQVYETLAEAAGKKVRNLIEALYGSLPESFYPLIGKLKEEKTNLEPPEMVFDWCWRNLKIEQIDLQIRENFIKYDINDPELQRIQQSLRNEKLELQKNLAGAFWFGEKSIFR
jgi:DNA primase